jgi:sugar O-acyltransferase (sialic acid O-acetyltransferase NeuD family)
MKDIILIGGGGHCKSVIDVIEEQGHFNIIGIVDKSEFLGSSVLGYPVIGNDQDLNKLVKVCEHALITVGQIKSASLRVKLFDLAVKTGFKLPKIVSPHAYVSKHAFIGIGVVVMHHAVINASASIGDNCIINSKTLIEHDCIVSKHCHISTNVTMNGGVKVEAGCFVGSNVTTKEYSVITENSFIKAGTVLK